MKHIYDIGDVVKVVKDLYSYDFYKGVKGIVKDVSVDHNNNTIYGLEIIEGFNYIGEELYINTLIEKEILLYFLAIELEEV